MSTEELARDFRRIFCGADGARRDKTPITSDWLAVAARAEAIERENTKELVEAATQAWRVMGPAGGPMIALGDALAAYKAANTKEVGDNERK